MTKPDPNKFRNKHCETERYKDITKNDWSESYLYKKALKDEAVKRGTEYNNFTSDSGEYTSYDSDKTFTSPRQL